MFRHIQFIALAVAAVFSGIVNAQTPCSRTYTVVAGDTCDAIAAAQGVSTYQIMSINKDTVDSLCNNLGINQVICLALPGNDCSPVQTVKSGDDCNIVAAAAGTDAKTLIANNPNISSNCSNIYINEVLCTATTVVLNPNY